MVLLMLFLYGLRMHKVGIVGREGTGNSKFGTVYVRSGARKALHSVQVTSYFDVEWEGGIGSLIDCRRNVMIYDAHTVWPLFASVPQV